MRDSDEPEMTAMTMRAFQHIAPGLRLFAGAECLGMLGRELDRMKSQRAVVFCGATLSRDAALMDMIRAAMGERCAGIFPGVRAHSPLPAVLAGADELRRLNADAVVAVGGGSAIVTARAAGILVAEGGDIRALATSRDAGGGLRSPRLLVAKMPQLVIPTTPTTAMVKAGSAVFDPANGERLALFDPKTRAQAIFMHPAFIRSAPRELIVSASLDTLSAALEGLMSRTGDPMADALLMHALRLLAQYLPGLVTDDDDLARGELMAAAVLAGRGGDHTGGGIASVLGHAIGAGHAMENGIAKAIVLPHVLRFNAGAAEAGLAKIATALGLRAGAESDVSETVIDAVEDIFVRLALPRRLRDVGVAGDALAPIAGKAMGDWFLRSNPRPVREQSELEAVLRAAW